MLGEEEIKPTGDGARSERQEPGHLPTVAEFLAHDWPMGLNPDFDGGCPCCIVRGEGFVVETHCWRTSRIASNGLKCACRFSGVHVFSDLDEATAQRLAEHMRDNNGWSNHTDWEIVIHAAEVNS